MKTRHQYSNSDLAQLYGSRMEQLGVKLDTRVHTTRLKQRLLAQFTDMHAQRKGRDVLMAFEEDIGLAKACEFDSDNEAIHLARAAKIVLSGKLNPLLGSQQDVKKNLCHLYCLL